MRFLNILEYLKIQKDLKGFRIIKITLGLEKNDLENFGMV